MDRKISPRLKKIIDALPLKEKMRVLEIGCGPGVAAREIVNRFDDVYVLAIDRSEKAIRLAEKGSQKELAAGKLEYRHAAIEDFVLQTGEKRFDLAFAVRVGALDGRHPETGKPAMRQIAKALVKNGRLFIDAHPVKELSLTGVPVK